MGPEELGGLTAVVLAAGMGTRFLPLTRSVPKPALHFLNRPILSGVLDALEAVGVTRAILNLHHLPDKVRRCASARDGRADLVFSFEPEILGTAGLYNPIRETLPEMFLTVNSDISLGGDLTLPFRDLVAHPEALASLCVLPMPPGAGYTGLDMGEDGTLRAFGGGGWMFAGLYAARASLLDALPRTGFLELVKDLLAPLLPSGRIRAVPFAGSWADLGTPGMYLAETARRLGEMAAGAFPCPADMRLDIRGGVPAFLHNSASLHPEAVVGGPVVLGEGASAEAGCVLDRAVLLEGARAVAGEVLAGAIKDGSGLVCRAC